MYQYCPKPFPIKQSEKALISPQNRFPGHQKKNRYTFPSSDSQCLPLTIPEFFAHNTGSDPITGNSFIGK